MIYTHALDIEWINYAGQVVSQYLPLYTSYQDCVWWGDFFKELIEKYNGGHVKEWTCKPI